MTTTKLATCSHCGVASAIAVDGTCPHCGRPVAGASGDADIAGEVEGAAAAVGGMTAAEQIYTAFVILCAGFYLVGLAAFHFIIIPQADNPTVFYFVVSILWMAVVAIAATTSVNLYYRSLATIPTIVQCVTLALAVYFLPFAIWGSVLLYRRLQRAKNLGYRSGPSERLAG